MSKKVYIYSNNKDVSIQAYDNVQKCIEEMGWQVISEYSDDTDYLVCIGGDGTFLSCIHKLKFPSTPVIGINTGHLGFFQEALPNDIKTTFEDISNDNYRIQNIKPVTATVHTDKGIFKRIAINEILIRGNFSHVSRFAVSIDNTKIQDFSGDGVLISTPVGSTAYNYSLGGSLVAPDLNVLQLTPVAPMNTNAYRCFHSSILLPADDIIKIEGIGRNTNGTIMLSFDGRTHEFNNVKYVEISQGDNVLNLVRFSDYDYWSKLSNKLL